MIMFSIADQGSVGNWAATHAVHHKMSDTEGDPHNRKAGFWHAQFGWIYASEDHIDYDHAECRHVQNALGPVVRFHDCIFLLWDPLWSLCMPSLLASFWGEAVNGFLVAGALRWMFVQHLTGFVNSVAHGEREGEGNKSLHLCDPSATGIGPRASILVTLLAMGEGWHDYHHLFPWDYAGAELNAWDQWNPTKFFIDACAELGLVTHRRRMDEVRQLKRRERMMTPVERLALCNFQIKGLPFFRYRAPVFKDFLKNHGAPPKDMHAEPSPEDLARMLDNCRNH